MDNPDAHVILGDQLSAEPIAAAMRQSDEAFVDTVNWMLSALLLADEHGVTQANVEEMAAIQPNPSFAPLLGATPGIGERLGLRETWAREMIAAVGNFGEIYDRNLGENYPYKLERGLNNLWSHGGVLYAPILDEARLNMGADLQQPGRPRCIQGVSGNNNGRAPAAPQTTEDPAAGRTAGPVCRPHPYNGAKRTGQSVRAWPAGLISWAVRLAGPILSR